MKYKYHITDEELSEIISIYKDENLTTEQKAEKFMSILTPRELDSILIDRNISKLALTPKLREVKRIYDIYVKYNYFNLYRETYKCSMSVAYDRLDALREMLYIIDSDMPEEKKLYMLYHYYRNSEQFRSNYSLFIKFGEKDFRIAKYKNDLARLDELQVYFDKMDRIVDHIKYENQINELLEQKKYCENYLYAEFLIKTYIDDKDSYKKHNFLSRCGISEDTFDYCVKLIKFLNPVLYQEYSEKVKKNIEIRYAANCETLRSIHNGIKTGQLKDGTPFDKIEFCRLVPFKNSGRELYKYLIDFMGNAFGGKDPIKYDILRYMSSNGLRNLHPAYENDYNNSIVSINGVQITPEMNKEIFRYMTAYGLPKYSIIYSTLIKMYIKGELDLSNLDEVEQKSKERFESTKIEIPYTLEKTL